MKTKITSMVVEGEVKAVEEEEVDDEDEQLRIVSLVCDAVDHEVESRSAAILAISDGHLARASVQLQWMMSTFPEHIRKMPIKKFLKQHCPNTKPSTRSDGTLCFHLVQDPAFQPPCGGTLGSWRDTMVTRNYSPMTEKIYPAMAAMQPSQIGNTLGGETKRKVTISRGLRI